MLNLIKAFRYTDEEMRHQTIEEYNADIEESEAEIERGEFYTIEQVEEMSKKWVSE